jgi:hypothetical protein
VETLTENAGQLPELYLKWLSQSIANRLLTDNDFEPARFPNTAAVFTAEQSNTTSTTTTSSSLEEDILMDEALNQS